MKLFSLIFTLFIIGCNVKYVAPKFVHIEPSLQSYVNQFVADGKTSGVNIIIDDLVVEFQSNLGDNILGECYMNDHGDSGVPTVYISSDEWPNLGVTQRQALLYHELGHCVLWLEHDTTWITTPTGDYIPKSIMYPYIGSEYDYDTYWNYYVYELFTGKSNL